MTVDNRGVETTDYRGSLLALADLLEETAAKATPGSWSTKVLPATTNIRLATHWVESHLGDETSESWKIVTRPWKRGDAEWIVLTQPRLAGHLVRWLRTEAASNAGDEDHSTCTAATCSLIAAHELALALLNREG